jgi:Arm DNA-binding domain
MFLIEAKGPEWRNEKHRAQWRMTRCRFRRPGATATVRHKFEVWFGGYPLVSLADARKARDAAEQLVQAGQDPITEREEAERAKLAKPDFWPDGRCETIDHLPAKIIFPNKSRPKGLEFPACKRCNSQTKSEEALLALVCRMAGSLRKNAVPDIDRAKDLWSTVDQVYPGLPQRMVKSREERTISGIIRPVSIIDLNQPEIAPALCRVAAKFAQAVYYEAYGRPSPEGTRINTT